MKYHFDLFDFQRSKKLIAYFPSTSIYLFYVPVTNCWGYAVQEKTKKQINKQKSLPSWRLLYSEGWQKRHSWWQENLLTTSIQTNLTTSIEITNILFDQVILYLTSFLHIYRCKMTLMKLIIAALFLTAWDWRPHKFTISKGLVKNIVK